MTAHTQARCARCSAQALPDGTRCAAHSCTTAAGQAWRDGQALRLTRRGQAVRQALRVLAVIAAAWLAWQAADVIAAGAADGIGGHGATAHAAGRTVGGHACATIDTGAGFATMDGRRYRYRDGGDALRWQAGTPAVVQALALAAIDVHAAQVTRPAPYRATACTRWRES